MAEPRSGEPHPWRARGRPPFDLGVLQAQHAAWEAANFPLDMNKPYRSLLGAMEELGELAHAQLKGEQAIRGTPEEHLAESIDAVGDIVIYLAGYCTKLGINMEEAVWQTWRKVRERDWRADPREGKGRATS